MYEDCPRDEHGAIIVKKGDRLLPKNCCPICGREFEIVQDINYCQHSRLMRHRDERGELFRRDELITDEDDYAWVY